MHAYENVLIVDDDAIVRTVLRGYFEGLAVRSIQDAAGGATAARMVSEHDEAFDLIVTDLSMPDEDGIQLLRRLHDQGFRGDVVIVSGRDTSIIETAKSLAKGHNLQVLGCICKPLSKGKLDDVFLADKISKSPSNLPDLLDEGALMQLFIEDGIVPYFQPKIS